MPNIYPIHLDMYKLLISLSEATDLVSPALVNHHKQVSYIAHSIAKTMGYEGADLHDIAIAGALHDIGGLSLASRIETLDFEMTDPEHHAVSGAILLSIFKPFTRIARLIRYHHVYWENGAGETHHNEPVPSLSHVLHLADRIAVLIRQNEEILLQIKPIVTKIKKNTHRMFKPEAVEAFEELAIRESFWFDAAAPKRCRILSEKSFFGSAEMTEQDMLDLSLLLCRIIDFRSRFTSTHSNGVSSVAEALAEKAGMTADECRQMKIAGMLHDIGKLVVPREILEKESPLTSGDYVVIHRHPYYSQRILQTAPGFETICAWSAYHHERLDGSGYPYHITEKEIPFGARILSVADTFTALTEVRPYRTGSSSRGTLKFLETQVAEQKLAGDIVALISQNIDEFHVLREAAQSEAYSSHVGFIKDLMRETEG